MQLGRRGTIIYAVKQRLEGIRTDRNQPTVTWDNDPDNSNYPIDVRSVLLEPEDPMALDRDNLLPCIVVQYSDGVRLYETGEGQYNNTNEIQENMVVNLRAVVRAQGNVMGEEDIPIAIVAANIHESIDASLGVGYDLDFRGIDGTAPPEQIPGMRAIKMMRWKVPYDLWSVDYMVIDFPIMVCHVFKRGKGV